MKKFLSVLFVLVLSVLLFVSCGKKTEAVKNVEAMINSLSDSAIDEDAISEIESAYNALSREEKEQVKNLNKLEKAKEELAAEQAKQKSYDEMNAAISQILDAAKANYSTDGTNYEELLSQAQEIMDKYEKLPDSEKEKVNVTDELSEAVDAITAYTATAEDSTATYVKAFYSVYADKKYEVSAVYCIKQIRDNTEYHIFALTYKDEKGEEHNLYANARCSANTTAETIITNAESFFAEKAVSDEYNAILGGNVELNLDAVLQKAKQ